MSIDSEPMAHDSPPTSPLALPDDGYFRREHETLEPIALAALQRQRLARLLEAVRAGNPFYRRKLAAVAAFDPLADELDHLPFTTRAELEQDQIDNPPYGSNLTYPVADYCRFHQTSGSGASGRPMRWLDTPASWAWFNECWGVIFAAAGVRRGDRLLFPFSFGPFVGFWAAFESAAGLGLLAIPAGGFSTAARLKMLLDNQVTVVCCTPTYALHMAQVAAAEGIDLAATPVRVIIVAGEAGGNIPEVRARIEAAWGAKLFDHHGMTEMGAVSFECAHAPGGLHIIESEFIAEVIDPQNGRPAVEGESGELVLTNLGRWGSPLIRYRTGDQVRLVRRLCPCGRHFARLEGGILGRIDDMFTVRGNNVFPPAVEAVVRRFAEVAEYRLTVHQRGALAEVVLEVEPMPGAAADALTGQLARALQETLHFRAQVQAVAPGALPRFELKAKRFMRRVD